MEEVTATTISIRVLIGSTEYSIGEVGDPEDVMFAVQVGRAVTKAIIDHPALERAAVARTRAAQCTQLEDTEYTLPREAHGTCAHCERAITWTPSPGLLHVGRWRHDSPATPDTRCSGAEPR